METPAAAPRPPLPTVGQFINEIWARYRRRLPVLLGVSLVANGLLLLTPFLTLIARAGLVDTFNLVLLVPIIILAIWGNVALIAAVAWPDRTPSIRSAFVAGNPFIVNSLITGLLYGLIVIVATIALVLPGIYFGVSFFLGSYLVVREGRTNMDALRRSRELIRGYWWAIFGRNLAVVFLFALAGLLLGIFFGAIFGAAPESFQTFMEEMLSGVLQWLIGPISVLAMAVCYEQLTAAKQTPNQT